MRLKKIFAALILSMILASIFTVPAMAAEPTLPIDATIYVKLEDFIEWQGIDAWFEFEAQADSGEKLLNTWTSFPTADTDREGYAKYHFLITSWGKDDAGAEKPAMTNFLNFQLHGNGANGYVKWHPANAEPGLDLTRADGSGKLVAVITIINDAEGANNVSIAYETTPAAAPAATTENTEAVPAATEAAPAAPAPAKAPATGDNDLAIFAIVPIAGAVAFWGKKTVLKKSR